MTIAKHQIPPARRNAMRPSAWAVVIGIYSFFLAPLYAWSQTYPSKPVHVIVVFPPGGSNDVTARIVFKKMEDNLEEQFIIDNRPGRRARSALQRWRAAPPMATQ
jgi:tripartite-type tricarboxylate transporter receptor subunit TctC